MIPHHGQTLNDRITAARYALAGQGLARVVCKATTEEMIAPKKKHIDYLLQCTHEPNVSIPQMANLLIERTQHTSWIVVFKALITVHHLMCYGNERFTQYLASSNFNFQLNNYLDKNAPKGYDMSLFIRRYARYINAKALSYRTVAFDFTKCKRGDESQMRQMGVEKLLKTVPVLQSQIDALLEFDCGPNDLNNGVINAAFLLLFKDLIRLFACYNDAIITCLEKYFELTNKKLARETLDIYKKFLIRMNKVAEFLKVAENVGIDRGDIPDLTKAPSSLLDAMEQHLATMEGRKPGTTSDKPSEEVVVKKAIEEEEKFLNKLKEKHIQEKKVNNPFLALSSSPNKTNETINETNKKDDDKNKQQKNDMIDLLLDDKSSSSNKNSNDLFSLESTTTTTATSDANNPFADILSSLNINPSTTTAGSNTSSPRKSSTNQQQQQSEFATSDGFAAAFGSSSNSNIDPKKSPTTERRPSKTAPSRPPPPPSTTTTNKEGKSGGGGSGATTPSKPKQPPSRPPAPSSNTPTPSTQQAPSAFPATAATAAAAAPGAAAAFPTAGVPSADGSNPQLQQFFQFQQQMMQMMLQNQQQTGQAPLDPAVMMAAMQMLYAQMLATGIMPTMAQCNAAATAAQAKADKENKDKTNETKDEQDKSVKEVKEEIEILEIEDDNDGGTGGGQDSSTTAAVVIEDADDGFDAFGDVLQPQNVSNVSSSSSLDVANNNNNSNNFVPISSSTVNSSLSAANNNANASNQVSGTNTNNTTGTIVKGDLDATLQNLAQNLDINSLKGNYKRGQQFNPNTRGAMKTGGTPTTNGTSGGSGAAATGSISPSSMMIRSPIIQTNTISSVTIPGISAGITGGIMGGWKNSPVMIGNSANWQTSAPASINQSMMPTMINPTVMSGLPTMRHPSMIPGAVPILPSNVDASTLSTILSGNSNNNNNKVNNSSSSISATNQSQSIDPFGAL